MVFGVGAHRNLKGMTDQAPDTDESSPRDDQRVGMGQAFGLLGGFVAGSVVAGLLAAGLFMPVVGAAGLGAKSMVESFDAMPAEFTASPMSQQTRILAADGSTIATLAEVNRQVVPLTGIAPVMQEAQIAVEDDRFYEHGGVDPRGVARALVATLRGDTQGASTITQQYVRQTLVTTALKNENEAGAEAALERSGVAGIVRKLQEMRYAVALEENLSKDQILEGYLNLVYYGAGAYGVEAAAQRYFSVPASELNLVQSAMIAGMVQRPSYTDPFVRPEETLERRNDVLGRMFATGAITKAEHDKAVDAPLGLDPSTPKTSCPAAVDPYFCDYVSNWMLEQPSLGETVEDRRRMLYRGGLTIETPYRPELAEFARETLIEAVPVEDSKNRGAAMALMEPGTGKVLAIAQNTDYGQGSGQAGVETTVNWSVDAKYGASAGFQIGSTVKPFSLVSAMENGMTPQSRLYAPPSGTPYTVEELGGDKCGFIGRPYRPKNNEGWQSGPMTLATATRESVNTAFVELASQIGVCDIQDTMARMGLHTGLGNPYGTKFVPNVILGADNASPLTLAASYATLAAGGKYCRPIPVVKVSDFEGEGYQIAGADCRQTVAPEAALPTTRILESVMQPGATGEKMALEGDRASAGKTGTADNNVQTWFAGYTPQIAAAAWVGRPNDQRPMRNVYGSTIAGPAWTTVMNEAHKGLPKLEFGEASTTAAPPETAAVPDVVGRSQNSATARLEDEGFTVEVAEEKVPSKDVDFGRVAETDPAAGTQAEEGATVTLRLSGGPQE